MTVIQNYISSSFYRAPSPNSIAIAKGIVLAFPELADEGDCPWVSRAYCLYNIVGFS